ncbi:Small nuclear ribonucleoprotein Sm D2 [Astathelohania contejeani]|uniref:Small nuclear ribonucleoprotein Sm D2 n=1 Tax=Astathelohania contejeani TaxID=164912 RepID=A0ABQ7HVM6_9MICR|nr:Small nuclear ribonucleoprotein Sm D2 [Thelohania contejeani]
MILSSKPRSEMTIQEVMEATKQQIEMGPLSLLKEAKQNKNNILISLRNNRKLACKLHSFDKHFNMILYDVTEIARLSSKNKGKKKKNGLIKERKFSNLFIRGDNVILIVKMED